MELIKQDQPVKYFQHTEGKCYVSISKGVKCVNICHYFLNINGKKQLPTRSGIALRLGEWEALSSKIRELREQIPELKHTSTCYVSDDLILLTSHPSRSLNPWSSLEIPPITATVRTPSGAPNLIASSSICWASSLVGARITAYGPWSESSVLPQQITTKQHHRWPVFGVPSTLISIHYAPVASQSFDQRQVRNNPFATGHKKILLPEEITRNIT